jgi:hypothetical protein
MSLHRVLYVVLLLSYTYVQNPICSRLSYDARNARVQNVTFVIVYIRGAHELLYMHSFWVSMHA